MEEIRKRKLDHIKISLEEDVAMKQATGFDQYTFLHQAFPECSLEEVSLETDFLDFHLGAPLLISSMTGGTDDAETINRHLAEAAEQLLLPIGVGSQRIIFEHPEVLSTFKIVRDSAPSVPVFGNLGLVQLNYGLTADHVQQAVDAIKANGIFLHLNPLQEAIQTGGDTNFRGLLDKIAEVVDRVNVPVFVKEVGCGIAPNLAAELVERGIKAIDVSGAGGTSWAAIEAQRTSDPRKRRLGEVFRDWGIPTTLSLAMIREELPTLPLIASGGIRTGLDVAKAIALGADLVAFAMPLLEPATRSTEAVKEKLEEILDELRMAMFLVGAKTVAELKAKRHLLVRLT